MSVTGSLGRLQYTDPSVTVGVGSIEPALLNGYECRTWQAFTGNDDAIIYVTRILVWDDPLPPPPPKKKTNQIKKIAQKKKFFFN